jgi:hypothetical protein
LPFDHPFRLSLALLLAIFALGLPQSAFAHESPGAVGHFDRDRIMSRSALFVGLNSKQLALVGPLESAMKRMDGALASLDLSVSLTEGTIDRAQRDLWKARLDERAGGFSSFFDAFQERFSADGQAYGTLFMAALERAVADLAVELGGSIVECAGQSASPFSLTGPGGATKSCAGEDLSARIAAAWDRDPALASALEQLTAAPWPALSSYESEQSALPRKGDEGTPQTLGGWVSPSRLLRDLPEAAELLDAIAQRAESGRRALVGKSRLIDREAEDAEAQLVSIRAAAKELRLQSEADKAALGELVWQAAARAVKKHKLLRKQTVGVCMNPPDWGGCSGADLTTDLRDALLADRKLQKQLGKQLDGLSP